MKKYNYVLLAEILRMRRIACGVSLRQLANEVGISHTELARIENGSRSNYNLLTIIKMCNALGMDFVKLLKITGYLPVNDGDLDEATLANIESFNKLEEEYPKGKDEEGCIVLEIKINE